MGEPSATDIDRGERIRDLMDRASWSPTHLAREMGVDRGRIYAWVKGEPISSENVSALAKVLGSSREFVLTGNEPDRSSEAEELDVANLKARIDDLEKANAARHSALMSELARVHAELETLRRPGQQPGQGRAGGSNR